MKFFVFLSDSNNPREFEIGVHIADVTYFVQPDSSIDIEARQRCTTVYLPGQNFPMLPRALSDHLCSLKPNEDKLTLSVIFRVCSDGSLSKTTPPWIGRTVIRSCCQFHYGEVQNVLNAFHSCPKENESDIFKLMDDLPHPDVIKGHRWNWIWQDLVLLESLTQEIRIKRYQQGSLSLHQSRLFASEKYLFGASSKSNDSIDDEDEDEDDSDETSHHLVEELMLLANKTVAEKIYNSSIGELSVLRFHPRPLPEKLKDLNEYLK